MSITSDLKSANLIKIKGLLFLFLGICSGTLLVVGHPILKTVLLLVITVWAFCRFYFFAFYVLEKYVDSSFRFSGLWSFVLYLVRRSTSGR